MTFIGLRARQRRNPEQSETSETAFGLKLDLQKIAILHYPDPHLRAKCAPVREFDADLAELAKRMIALMRGDAGVGLAAPQVGVPIRLFVMNLPGEEANSRVFVNPVISHKQGKAEAEEGCLSLPSINVQVTRAAQCRITAQDLEGNPIELEAKDLQCRIWQHETDHLDGVLIIDRMGPSDRIATRNTLKALVDVKKRGGKKPGPRR